MKPSLINDLIQYPEMRITSLQVKPDSSLIAIGFSDGTLKIFNLSSNKEDFSIKLHQSSINDLLWTEHDVILSASQDSSIKAFDPLEKTILSEHNGPVMCL